MASTAYLGHNAGVTSVGYLERGTEYPQGEVSEEYIDRLVGLVKHPLLYWFGYHNCELDPCGLDQVQPERYYKGELVPNRCCTDILIPAENLVYIAPSLILHYILYHKYQPPACFLDAALRCPEPGSDEYIDAINRVGTPFGPFPTSRDSQCSSET